MSDNVGFVLGTMTFGEQVFGNDVSEMINTFFASGNTELDTAYVYNEGLCEELLGEALQGKDRNSYQIATKVNPRVTGRLDKDAVLMQCNESLKRLRLEYVDTLYLHFPDRNTPVVDALEGCARLWSEGKFKHLGLSNFPAWLVADVYHICKSKGWVLPTVYEGLYNPLSRRAERELDFALDNYGMRFYAYNPLAGGVLTDKYSGKESKITEGRFINRPNYKQRYWKDSFFNAADSIKNVCKKYGISIAEASYRWLLHHSMLSSERGDAVIIGASRLSQLEQNLAADMGPLPDEITDAINTAWNISCVDAPEYFKYYN